MRLRMHSLLVVLTVMSLSLVSCSHFGHGARHAAKGAEATPTETAVAEVPKDDQEAKLRSQVRSRIEAAASNQEDRKKGLVERHPYYFKEYEVFPEGPDSFTVELQQTESRTAPYVADVKMKKIRVSTRLHREREQALADENFLRDRGLQTETYELRNGKWRKSGGLFVADKSEENINGEWVPVQESAPRTVATEEEQSDSWFQKTWSWITGR